LVPPGMSVFDNTHNISVLLTCGFNFSGNTFHHLNC
jgi:hypothetical protein